MGVEVNVRLSMRQFTYAMVALCMLSAMLLVWKALQTHESTLAIRPVIQGSSVPDGFSI